MRAPWHPVRALGAVLLLCAVSTMPVGAAPCSGAAPSSAAPMTSGSGQGPSIEPTKLPEAGGGGAADECANDPSCSGTSGSSGGFGSAGQAFASNVLLAFVGSAPGRGHGGLLMLAPARGLDQAVGCGQPTLPGGGPSSPGTSGVGAPGAPPPCPPPPGPPALPDPATVARGIALPWPTLTIRAAPSPIGLDGLPTWFWIAGYDGRPVAASRTVQLPGQPNPQPGCPGGPGASEDVAVQATPTGYTWQFGDGRGGAGVTTSGLGAPYPRQAGAITHQFEATSGGGGQPGGFLVQMTAHFHLAFRTGAGPWQALLDTDRQATLRYPVREAYPVIVGP